MERSITIQRPGIRVAPPVNTRRLTQIVAAAGAAVLVVAVAWSGTGSAPATDGQVAADGLRWQAVAAAYENAAPPARAAESARWSAIAGAHTALTTGQEASADRWSALAAAHSALSPAQAAYAARLGATASR